MNEPIQIINIASFFINIPIYLKPWFSDDKPFWHILNHISEAIEKIYEANPSRYIRIKENVYIDKTAVIDKYTEIKGPALIGKGCVIRHGAFLRNNVITGDNCVIGNSTEIKNSVLFNNVQAPHFNYIGDSVLGNYAHLGAGVVISNALLIKNKDENSVLKDVKIKMPGGSWTETGRRKFGAVIGDYAEIGTNTTINPGTLLESNILVPPSACIGGYFMKNYKFPKTIVYPKEEKKEV